MWRGIKGDMIERCCISVISLIVAAIPVAASAKNCNEVKAEIDVRFKANGTTNFGLEIVDASSLELKKRVIVGTCDGGAKKIIFREESATEEWMLQKISYVLEHFRRIAARIWKATGM